MGGLRTEEKTRAWMRPWLRGSGEEGHPACPGERPAAQRASRVQHHCFLLETRFWGHAALQRGAPADPVCGGVLSGG